MCASVSRQLCGVDFLLTLLHGSRDLTQIARIVWKVPLPSEPSGQPPNLILDFTPHNRLYMFVFAYVCTQIFLHVRACLQWPEAYYRGLPQLPFPLWHKCVCVWCWV